MMGAQVGEAVLIYRDAIFYNHSGLTIGSRVFINDRFWCNAKGKVTICDEVIMGPGVTIHSSNHNYANPEIPIMKQGHTDKPVVVEANVWIGANVTVLPGVTIGSRAVIAAGAVVTRDLEGGGIYAGIPARRIKDI